MRANIIVSPANPTRLWIVDQADESQPWPGTDCVYAYQFERPVTLVGADPDHLLISSLKMFAGQLGGFPTWQHGAAVLASIEDVEAAAESYGTTWETLISNGNV